MEMNGTTVVPGDVFDSIRGKDVNVVFDLGDGITWTVNGKDITADKVGDIDFGVTVGSQAGNTIPVEIINNVTGERYSVNVSLAYDGEFGFTAILTLNVDKENAGLYANLFYYNPGTGNLEYISSGMIDREGNAALEFTHASDYVIVVNEKDMSQWTMTEGQDVNGDSSVRADVWKNLFRAGAVFVFQNYKRKSRGERKGFQDAFHIFLSKDKNRTKMVELTFCC